MKRFINIKQNHKLLVKETFYFLSVILGLGVLTEIVLPGFFRLYFNFAILAAAWLLNLIYLLLCITVKK